MGLQVGILTLVVVAFNLYGLGLEVVLGYSVLLDALLSDLMLIGYGIFTCL